MERFSRATQVHLATSSEMSTAGLISGISSPMFDEKSGYFVPCVWKALRTLDLLKTTPGGLRIADLVTRTGYARGTVYRIVRTLAASGYAIRESNGVYHADNLEFQKPEPLTNGVPQVNCDVTASERGSDFERWGVRFHAGGSRCKCAHADTSECE